MLYIVGSSVAMHASPGDLPASPVAYFVLILSAQTCTQSNTPPFPLYFREVLATLLGYLILGYSMNPICTQKDVTEVFPIGHAQKLAPLILDIVVPYFSSKITEIKHLHHIHLSPA